MELNLDIDVDIDKELYDLWVLFDRTNRAMRKAREIELKTAEVSLVQSGVLLILCNSNAGVSPSYLQEYLSREHHTITGLVNRMESQGLLSQSKKNGRITISITEKGRDAYEGIRKMKVVKDILSSLNKKERHNLNMLLAILHSKAVSAISKINL